MSTSRYIGKRQAGGGTSSAAASRKAMESNDGNWVMKTDGFVEEETKLKQSLRLRNDAVSKLFEAELKRQELEDREKQAKAQQAASMKVYVRRQNGTSSGKPSKSHTVKGHTVKMKKSPVASVYVNYPAYSTLPRQRIQSEGRTGRRVYAVVPRSLSVPQHQVLRDTPSPTPTISQFLAEEGELHVQNSFQPHSDNRFDFDTRMYTQDRIRDKQSRERYNTMPHREPISPTQLSPRYDLSPKHSPRYNTVGRHAGSKGKVHGAYVIVNKPPEQAVIMKQKSMVEYTAPVQQLERSSSVPDLLDGGEGQVYRGQVVRIQVPNYAEAEPEEYKTYTRQVGNAEEKTTSNTPQQTDIQTRKQVTQAREVVQQTVVHKEYKSNLREALQSPEQTEYRTYPEEAMKVELRRHRQEVPAEKQEATANGSLVESADETKTSEVHVKETSATDVNANEVKQEFDVQELLKPRDHSPRTVVLQKGKSGFGFVLRGAKSEITPKKKTSAPGHSSSTLDFIPTADFPALQYLDRVDKGSPADRAGLKPGDFLLEINNEAVVNATHEHTVRLIKASGDTLAMRVVTVRPHTDGVVDIHMDGTRTLPNRSRAPPPVKQPMLSLRDSKGQGQVALEGMEVLEKLDATLAQYDTDAQLDQAAQSRAINIRNKTASIGRHNQRMSAMPIQEIFSLDSGADGQTNAHNTTNNDDRQVTNVRLSRVPDNDRVVYGNEERVYAVPFKNGKHYGEGSIPPPPTHAPPRPPQENSGDSGEIVRINTSHSGYSNVAEDIAKRQSPVESSFRPGVSARMSSEQNVVVHSRDSSMSSNVSSMSSHSEPHKHRPSLEPTPQEPAPDYDEESPRKSVDSLSQAIRAAAAAREIKTSPQTQPKASPNKVVQSAPKAAPPPPKAAPPTPKMAPPPPKSAPPPPPPPPASAPPPPPPPPIALPTAGTTRQTAPAKAPMPAHVQRQLEENQRQEMRHAALMAAIAKRRNVVDQADMESVAQNIESRVQKSSHSKSLVFDSKNKKPEVKSNNPAPVAPLVASLRQAKIEHRPRITTETPDRQNNSEQRHSTNSDTSQSSQGSDNNDSFTAKAEKARKEYLAKKNSSPAQSAPVGNIGPAVALQALEKRRSIEAVESKVRAPGTTHTLLDTRRNKNINNNNPRRATSNREETEDTLPPPPGFDDPPISYM